MYVTLFLDFSCAYLTALSCVCVFVCEVNEEEVVKKASSEGSGDPSLFSSALAHINSSSDKAGSGPPRPLWEGRFFR